MYDFLRKFIILIIVFSADGTYGQKLKCYNSQADTVKFIKVPLKNLMTDPDKYNGQWIETEGIYSAGFEYSTLELSGEVKPNRKLATFWVDFDKKINCSQNLTQLDEIRVLLRGKINSDEHGHLGAYDAAIDNVYYIEQL